jgi:carboxymethylenebutenolidase
MSLHTEYVRYGEGWSGYLARPARARTPLPGVVVLQEAWGVDDHIEDVTRRLAAAGYAAFAPDLYAKDGARPAEVSRDRVAEMLALLNTLPPEAFRDAAVRDAALAAQPEDVRRRFAETRGVIMGEPGRPGLMMRDWTPQLTGASKFLREQCAATRGQPVGCVGFCMGGGLSALLACADPEIAGAGVFYGMSPPAEKVAAAACPIIGFYGATDARINASLPAFEAAMLQHGRAFYKHVYEGAGHSFFNDTRPSYEVRASRDSFARLLDFFRTRLGG